MMEKKTKMMVVDDEERFRGNLVKLLGQAGYSTAEAGSGEEALEKLAANSFNLVLLDVTMPGLSGVATMRRIRVTGCKTVVIFLTGHASLDDALEVIKLGAADYLLKPLKTEKLVEKIEPALSRKS